MKVANRVILRCLAVEFYKENMLPFIIMVYFAIGILQPVHHVAIASFIMQGTWQLAVLFVLWILIFMYIRHFVNKQFRRSIYGFLYGLSLLPTKKRWLMLGELTITLFAPVLFYGVFMMYQGWIQGAFLNSILLGLYLIVLFGLFLNFLHSKVTRPEVGYEIKQSMFSFLKIRKPSWSFVFFQIMDQKIAVFIITKLLSAGIVVGLLAIFDVGTGDPRPMMIAMLIMAGVHYNIIEVVFRFHTVQLLTFNQLPLTLVVKFCHILCVLALIALPEMALTLLYAPDLYPWWSYLAAYILVISLMMMIYVRMFIVQDIDLMGKQLTFSGIMVFFLMMFKLYLVVTILIVGLAYYWFKKHYYCFQALPESQSD